MTQTLTICLWVNVLLACAGAAVSLNVYIVNGTVPPLAITAVMQVGIAVVVYHIRELVRQARGGQK